jgi:hypothetical protein
VPACAEKFEKGAADIRRARGMRLAQDHSSGLKWGPRTDRI